MDPDELVRQGRHAEAARAAREAGDLARARVLYEQLWEFPAAAECALEAGDRAAALRNWIEARDLDRASALAAEMLAAGEGAAAAAVYEARHRQAEAAALHEQLGNAERAAALYQRAGSLLDAGRMIESLGRLSEAGRLYERFLETEPEGPAAARARLALGRLLATLRQHEPAARWLQAAARDEASRPEALRLLVGELAALGLRDAARDVLARARLDDPTLPADLDEHLSRTTRPRRPEAEADTLLGGRWRLGKLLGSGGSGRVFLARDEVGGREVAVKVFHAIRARGRDAYERFLREARVCGAVKHPNLVQILDVREQQGFLVMEHMVGGTLAGRLRPRLPPRQVRRLALDVCAGLEYAHSRGVVHRDIKPANVFFDGRGTAKLGDFGVAHLLDLGQTQTGGLIGTLAYMSPEQITGAPLTFAADLYALGVTLFQALTGRLPFLGPDFVAQHLGEPPPRPSEVWPELGPAWDAPLARLLEKDPASRHGATDELREELERIEPGGRTVLVLGRGGGERAAESAAPAAESARPSAEGRYQAEVELGETPVSRLYRAVDRALDRSVVIERFAEGHPDAAASARLLRCAAVSSPYLQRVLAWDRAARTVVYEAPVGETVASRLAAGTLTSAEVDRLMVRVNRALALLQAAGGSYGPVDPGRIVVDDHGNPTLIVAGTSAQAG